MKMSPADRARFDVLRRIPNEEDRDLTDAEDIELHRLGKKVAKVICGTPLPKLVRAANPPTPLCQTTDGNYCSSCEERLDYCACLPPMCAFVVEGA